MKFRHYFEMNLLLAAVLTLAVSTLGAAACESSDSKDPEPSAGATTTQPSEEPNDEPAKPVEDDNSQQQVAAEQADDGSQEPGGGDLLGRVTREMIEKQRDDWRQAVAQASPDKEAAKALAEVEPGAKLTIYFGSWCSDCQRELPRFFKATDIAGELPFRYELIGVDKYFRAGEVSQEPLDLAAIPAFIVERDGEEVGRVIESSPSGIEKDLLALLRAEKSGVISSTR